ncbi:pyridoxamine 5'-phosphate oxidase [Sandaracinobacter sp. RS1-74]|uniref:pyridoxamine 5'-phosphate oxidase n=1 Tax=Sandaracinobacteroides sayramensis TaxID=2913411 RepID=UPI001EDC4E17|nr:pyridoxamine 5'-phosphate oxidase [Sandaracinobacteroides sayramensis]MCG2839692.1 pyridoxamine 5'-phosphate oxidase [Sandaracinobacteroides sayramensis]
MTHPLQIFEAWFVEAQERELNDANACALATVDLDQAGLPRPDVRIVLLKGVGAEGFTFFTNYRSAKGLQLSACPVAALDFHWKSLRRQVRVQGVVARVSESESDEYFATRPRESQLSAWASRQSEPLDDRSTFEARLAEAAELFPGEIPRPAHWGGYRLRPDWIEFWEDRVGRQHHRERFSRVEGGWDMQLLYP